MKKTLICPKCEGRKLWRIESLKFVNAATGQPDALPIAYLQGIWKSWGPTGAFEVFICQACSYSELYADGVSGLVHKPEKGVHFIDNEPKPDRGPNA